MRIGLVSQEYPPETAKGGIGSQTHAKAHGLNALGHEVHVISRTLKPQLSQSEDGKVLVTRVPGLSSRMPVHTEPADWLGYSMEVAWAIASLHAQKPFDVIEFPEWGAEGYFHLLNRTSWNRIPTAIHLHGPIVMFAHQIGWPDMESEFYRVANLMEGTCLRLADAVISSSRCSAEWCAKHYGLNGKHIPVIHTGVDVNHFAPRPIPKSERPLIVFTGKLVPNKGVYVLVEAACRLGKDFPGLRLRLAGRAEPKVATELMAVARASGQPQLLEMPGFIDRSALPIELSQAHVFAAPSRYEGGPGFVYLEAMACGLPVIACSGSGVTEIVREGENGFLVPPDDAAALEIVLRRLLGSPGLRQTMGAYARRFVLEHANSDTCMKKLESFYRTVAEGGFS